ncbi:unnamed protein product [Owenia fusiformis]|uniref:Uncharacterized protein n=1 Tax=Owenia fusiformis TaxID=6347 RepID=A0A8S4NXN9_OWEFU|nr:unnamed protein product [Owenia fusiformis]
MERLDQQLKPTTHACITTPQAQQLMKFKVCLDQQLRPTIHTCITTPQAQQLMKFKVCLDQQLRPTIHTCITTPRAQQLTKFKNYGQLCTKQVLLHRESIFVDIIFVIVSVWVDRYCHRALHSYSVSTALR